MIKCGVWTEEEFKGTNLAEEYPSLLTTWPRIYNKIPGDPDKEGTMANDTLKKLEAAKEKDVYISL